MQVYYKDYNFHNLNCFKKETRQLRNLNKRQKEIFIDETTLITQKILFLLGKALRSQGKIIYTKDAEVNLNFPPQKMWKEYSLWENVVKNTDLALTKVASRLKKLKPLEKKEITTGNDSKNEFEEETNLLSLFQQISNPIGNLQTSNV